VSKEEPFQESTFHGIRERSDGENAVNSNRGSTANLAPTTQLSAFHDTHMVQLSGFSLQVQQYKSGGAQVDAADFDSAWNLDDGRQTLRERGVKRRSSHSDAFWNSFEPS
jgi:hypothetical protein